MIRDITRILTNGFPAWPGDPPFALDRVRSFEAGDPCEVSRITMSAHAGTHLDAPSHVVAGAGDLGAIPLEALVGPALVVHVAASGAITTGMLSAAIRRCGASDRSAELSRVLIRTSAEPSRPERTGPGRAGGARSPNTPGDALPRKLEAPSPITAARALPEAFTALTIEAARHLVRAGVRLVGIDTPSIDDPQAADLPVHRVLAREGVAILEWLDLEQVQEGIYQLVALPLRLDPSEASPVRAILIERS